MSFPVRPFRFLVWCAATSSPPKNIGRDIMASAKTLVGGEIKSYTMMTNEARQIAEDRMIEQAAALGADAIVAMRFSESAIMQGTIEMLAYGTAVKFI